jgi:hypothetical protein
LEEIRLFGIRSLCGMVEGVESIISGGRRRSCCERCEFGGGGLRKVRWCGGLAECSELV